MHLGTHAWGAEEEPAGSGKRKSKEGKEGKREKHKHKSKDRSKDAKREKRDSETPKAADAVAAPDALQQAAADAPKAQPAPELTRERKRRWDAIGRSGWKHPVMEYAPPLAPW